MKKKPARYKLPPPRTSRQFFEIFMRKNRIDPSSWFEYWPFWKAGVAWQRKQ
jgi:hypothetical protein